MGLTTYDYDDIRSRIAYARSLGWEFEDSRLTPGVPRLGVRRPGGEIVGVIFSTVPDRMMEEMEKMQIPKAS